MAPTHPPVRAFGRPLFAQGFLAKEQLCLHESFLFGTGRSLSKVDANLLSGFVDIRHLLHLMALLRMIALINAYRVGPEQICGP